MSKAKMTALILGKLKPSKPVEAEDDGAEESGDVGLESAVAEFFSSGKKGDYAAAAEALRDAIDLCK